MSKRWFRSEHRTWFDCACTDSIERCRHVEKNYSANLATVDDTDQIIVQPQKFCFRRMIVEYGTPMDSPVADCLNPSRQQAYYRQFVSPITIFDTKLKFDIGRYELRSSGSSNGFLRMGRVTILF